VRSAVHAGEGVQVPGGVHHGDGEALVGDFSGGDGGLDDDPGGLVGQGGNGTDSRHDRRPSGE
jgi:hypothetical protein